MPYCNSSVDLTSVLQQLAEMQINDVLLETGATLSGAMLQAGLIDELIIYIAPVLMGNNARGLFALPGLEKMQDKIELDITEQRMVGQDIRIIAKVRKH
ncbi:MAG: dihydrofolate reductase family protein, partial [Gammaproteobacteria bacterium]|nr:dihydrofolate reductase family protein [Gammaproteobacteria bacterium]